jgi:hypothetical protein
MDQVSATGFGDSKISRLKSCQKRMAAVTGQRSAEVGPAGRSGLGGTKQPQVDELWSCALACIRIHSHDPSAVRGQPVARAWVPRASLWHGPKPITLKPINPNDPLRSRGVVGSYSTQQHASKTPGPTRRAQSNRASAPLTAVGRGAPSSAAAAPPAPSRRRRRRPSRRPPPPPSAPRWTAPP